ncbi:hypothetical protein GE09DRAFT_1213337 [Coniochaeta sp. 2T2.1]|nr:hypothetical protein GE09DRAFT_1213337 [Coniochaeta sp. 2T2.1]
MYKAEVPLYGQLVDIVRKVDSSILEAQGKSIDDLPTRHQLERHGAIRLGTDDEMRMVRRLFAILGMYPVGYYDLETVGFPLHGTAFRPTSEDSLRNNPFRVFTTLLRPGLIKSPSVRERAMEILSKRTLFSPRLCELVQLAEEKANRDLTAADADELINESLKIFKWHSRSTVDRDTYVRLKREHPMVADIVCFPSAHVNHLTPRTLGIDTVQAEMARQGLPAKDSIEGPPAGRKCEVLLRQTSFKALEERVVFIDDEGAGTHTARFGEVEQRGAAVTRKGRDLYDRLLALAIALHGGEDKSLAKRSFDDVLVDTFREYPDDWTTLRAQGLVYFRYTPCDQSDTDRQRKLDAILGPGEARRASADMEALLQAGLVECEPMTYEDFLPFSAAGIFTSNLGGTGGGGSVERRPQDAEQFDSRAELEAVLGCEIPSEVAWYGVLRSRSVEECEKALGLGKILLPHAQ